MFKGYLKIPLFVPKGLHYTFGDIKIKQWKQSNFNLLVSIIFFK